MKVYFSNNASFGARIRISKAVKTDLRDASIISGLGTTASGAGVLSNLPMMDPAHHVHDSAKILDSFFSSFGDAIVGIGTALMTYAGIIVKGSIKKTKIPS